MESVSACCVVCVACDRRVSGVTIAALRYPVNVFFHQKLDEWYKQCVANDSESMQRHTYKRAWDSLHKCSLEIKVCKLAVSQL